MASETTFWTVHCRSVLVGKAQLRWYDEGMNVRGGQFLPGPGYSALRSVFQLFASAQDDGALLDQYYRDRDALGLIVRDEDGSPVQGTVHIEDFSAVVIGAELKIVILPPDG